MSSKSNNNNSNNNNNQSVKNSNQSAKHSNQANKTKEASKSKDNEDIRAYKSHKQRSPHDALIKEMLETKTGAIEFLEEYLPKELQEKIELSEVQVEKESFVEKNLKRQYSDIILSIPLKSASAGEVDEAGDNAAEPEPERAYAYVLLENQVTSDYWISMRLWKYVLLLCERYVKQQQELAKQGKKRGQIKLPLIWPIVFYHGAVKYSAPKSFWELFSEPELAQKALGGEYQLIDLQGMSDEELNYEQHISILLYLLKHIHEKKEGDILSVVSGAFEKCKEAIKQDEQLEYVYIKLMIWYIESKVPQERQEELEQIIAENLTIEEQGKIMRSIAQKWIDQGIEQGKTEGKQHWLAQGIDLGRQQGIDLGRQQGIDLGKKQGIDLGRQQGIDLGKQQGIDLGRQQGISQGISQAREEARKEKLQIAKNLLSQGVSIEFVAKATGLKHQELRNLSNK